MDLPTLLSQVSVTALILLVIIGGLIAFEIYMMIHKTMPQKKKGDKPEEGPDTMAPLKFPKISNVKIKSKKRKPIKLSIKSIITIGIIILVVSGAAGIAYMASTGRIVLNIPLIINIISPGSAPVNEPATPTPSPLTVTDYSPQIILYRETLDDHWQPLTEAELSLLNEGDIIRIAVKTTQPASSIEITVNGQSIPLANDISPQQEPYARYIIPQGRSEYKVAARVF